MFTRIPEKSIPIPNTPSANSILDNPLTYKIAASLIIAAIGIALYKTTVGKFLIFGGIGAAVLFFAIHR